MFLQRDFDQVARMAVPTVFTEYGRQFEGESALQRRIAAAEEWRIVIVGVRLAAAGRSGNRGEATTARPPTADSVLRPTSPPARAGFTVSFAALLSEQRARDLASSISVDGQNARVLTGTNSGTTVYRVVLGPYPSRDDAERAGKAAGKAYWIYEDNP